jgi:hypothetical protein
MHPGSESAQMSVRFGVGFKERPFSVPMYTPLLGGIG